MPLSLAVDIHCHLLPDWDDGPPSTADSLQLATRLAGCGVGTAFVTPHVDREEVARPNRLPSRIPLAVREMQSQLHAAGIALDLVPGAEVMLSRRLPERLPDEPWLCLGNLPQSSESDGLGPAVRHILVELRPQSPWTPEVDALLFQIALQGVTPILAHPERYHDIQRDLSIARALASRGVLLQISAASLLPSRRATSIAARALLQEGLAAFVASDAHSMAGVVLERACAEVEALLGEQGARQVLVENPRRLLEGREVVVTPRPPAPSGSIWSRWLRRGEP